ncbi:WD40 repeat domain-containing protein [Spirulina sp. 06S082]|uniref:WD40 repeat domain-containing protein n=1 Tax=Spirulina sp. 06S082 TaxID=3110248 RepID=UPI002B20CBB5|nr:WD40 repeat domain-containing protein [Spirulina sp. 06S082]MEA5469652.1 WD40 repeat domain-containing protein [Spirulina sp. 06S082]
MKQKNVETYIFPKELAFKPGDKVASFEITAINQSDRFAGFQIEITAAGADTAGDRRNWYSIHPEVSTKNPPGDSTKFLVTIIDTPIPGFVGLMNLTVRIFSMDLADEDREILRLNVEQSDREVPLVLEMPVKEFLAKPGEQIDIPVEVFNPSQLPTNATLHLQGLNPKWLDRGVEKYLPVGAGKEAETFFSCQLPATHAAIARVYPFKIQASRGKAPPTFIEASLEIAPEGTIEFHCENKQQNIPKKWGFLPGWNAPPVNFQLDFDNRSNLDQKIAVQLEEGVEMLTAATSVQIEPEQLELLPGDRKSMEVTVRSRRPLLGFARQLALNFEAVLSDRRVGNTSPGRQLLRVKVSPIVPLWLLLLGIPSLIYFAWKLSYFNPENSWFGHQAAVNSVAVNGDASSTISGSNDRTIRMWDISGFKAWNLVNPEIGIVGATDKAVRVVRYKPVDNNAIAAGLENGEIQLWDSLSRMRLLDSFVYRKDDRVLALTFTRDSRYLLSGHGSGLVLKWNMEYTLDDLRNNDRLPKRPVLEKQMDFAVYALELVDREDDILAIAGRFNQLVLWNMKTDRTRVLPYRKGGKDDYIFSLATAELRPGLLATADNQGEITLWNLNTCLSDTGTCQILDRWSDGHGDRPVRSVSLSRDGCYLASGGDDGRVVLWPLSPDGSRAGVQYPKGIELARSYPVKEGWFFNKKEIYPKINSVNTRQGKDWLYVASGSDDTQLRVSFTKRLPELSCDAINHNHLNQSQNDK